MLNIRLNNISLVRMLAVIFIFLHHVICGLYSNATTALLFFPLSVGVEIFLFISAFLYGNKKITNFKSFFKKRFIYIFLPYYIFVVSLFIFYLIFNPEVLTTWEIIQGLFCLYIFDNSFHPLRHFWFLPIIMICYLLLPILQKLFDPNTSTKTQKIIKFLLTVIILTELVLTFNGTHMQFTCFILGYYFANKKDYNKLPFIKTIPLFLLICGLYIIARGSNLIFDAPALSNIIGQVCMLFMGILLTLILLKIFNFLNKKPTPMLLKISDKCSYQFYIVHQIFLIGQLSLLHLTPYLILNIIIAFAVSCFVGGLLYKQQQLTLEFANIINKRKYNYIKINKKHI